MRKPVFLVSNQVRHKAGCRTTEDGQWHEISHQGSRGIVYAVRTEALISCTVTAQLICAFVFALQNADFLMMQLKFRSILPALTQNSPIIESGLVRGVCVKQLRIKTSLCRRGA